MKNWIKNKTIAQSSIKKMLVLLLNPVYSHTEKSFYRQFSMNNKIKIIRINTGFVSLSLRPLEANKTGFNFLF